MKRGSKISLSDLNKILEERSENDLSDYELGIRAKSGIATSEKTKILMRANMTGIKKGPLTDKQRQARGDAQRGIKQSEERIAKRAKSLQKPCTVDGVTIYPSKNALIEALGSGKAGRRHPDFRFLKKSN